METANLKKEYWTKLSLEMATVKNETISDNRKLHHLEKVPARQVLCTIFKPFICATKFAGVFPLHIKSDGSAEFKYISWNTLYTLVFLFSFILDTVLFLPAFTSIACHEDLLDNIVETVYVFGQYMGTLTTLLSIPYFAPRLARCWNDLQTVITTLVNNGHAKMYISTYRGAQITVKIWFTIAMTFCGLVVYNYFDKLNNHLSKQDSTFMYWLNWVIMFAFPVMMTFHLVHSIMFVTFTHAIKKSFQALSLTGRSNERRHQLEVVTNFEINEALHTYDKLNDLVRRLGKAYGFYMIVEIVSNITCTVTNVFFLYFHPKGRETYSCYIAVISCTLWLNYMCNAGEDLRRQSIRCQKTLRAMLVQNSTQITTLLDKVMDPPEQLTACGYFNINRQLQTSIFGTITTYLVVMVQFRISPHRAENKVVSDSMQM